MNKRLTVLAAGLMGLLALTPIIIGADTPKVVKDTPTLEKLEIDMSDLLSVTFLNIYKYHLVLPQSSRFHVILREQHSAESPPRILSDDVFHVGNKNDLNLRISFLSLEDRFSGVLLSDEKQAEFRIAIDGTTEPEVVRIVPVPLADVDRTYLVMAAHIDTQHPKWASQDGAIQLLAIFPSTPANQHVADRGYPRAELVVIAD